jgi:putative DNA primase/helicase
VNGATALQKIAVSPVVVIAEGYATSATIAKHAKAAAIAAFDSGNLLEVAVTLRERYKDKQIIIAGDDDHRLENNPGRAKALEAAAAVSASEDHTLRVWDLESVDGEELTQQAA